MANQLKRILLFSAGMDSVMLKHLFQIKNEECLFVSMGTIENEMERSIIEEHYPGVLQVNLPLIDFELPNKIIPFRNAFLILAAAQFSPYIILGSTAGDSTRDKDYTFAALMTSLMQYVGFPPDKAPPSWEFGVRVQVEMPLKGWTKTQIIRHFLDEGGNVEALRFKSASCYEEGGNCGRCRSCQRKYVALRSAGVSGVEAWFVTNPRDFLQETLAYSERVGRVEEAEEIRALLKN